jgi:uncharacterized protein YaiL (DUF2058 family)
MVEELSRGSLAIVRSGPLYEIIPAAAAQRISALAPKLIVLQNTARKDDSEETDDPYAGFAIPDDLMW